MERRQGASAAEKKAREHPQREKHKKHRGSAVKTVKPQNSHIVHRVLMSTLSLFYI